MMKETIGKNTKITTGKKRRSRTSPNMGLALGQSYWTAEENGLIIRRDNEVPLNQMQRRMYDLNFKKTIYGCMHKRRKLTKKNYLKKL